MHKISLTSLFLTLVIALCVKAENRCDLEGNKFPDRVTTDAKGFEIKYFDTYKLVTNKLTQVQYRVDCEDTLNSQAHFISLAKIGTISASLESLGFLELLGVTNKIVAISAPDDIKNVTSPCVVDQIQNKGNSTAELVFSAESSDKTVILGFKDDMTPLEKAEWILFVGAILNLDGLAQTKYDEIKNSYNCHRDNLSQVDKKQIAWIEHSDNQFKLKSDTYYKTLIADAGGSPIDSTQNSYNDLPSFQKAIEKAAFAVDQTAMNEINRETWLRRWGFNAVDTTYLNNLYRTDRLINNNTVSDWIETSPSRPDLALQDLIAVQYGDYQKEYSPRWFIKLNTGFQRKFIDTSSCQKQDIPVCTKNEYKVSNPPKYNGSTGNKKSNTGAIAGGVVGGVVGALAIGGIVFYGRKKYRQSSSQDGSKQGWDFISLKSGRSTASLA